MLWETSQQLTNLPPLSPESRRVLAEFLNVDQDVNELANELSEDFFDVVQRLCDPALKAWITAINALKNNERRERALHALDITLTSERNPNLIRRAATRILRHLELTKSVPRPRAIDDVGEVTTDQRESHTPTTSMRTTRDTETNITHPQPTNQLAQTSNNPLPFSVPSVTSVVDSTTNRTRSQQLSPHPHLSTAQSRPPNPSTPYPHPSQDSPNLPPSRHLSGCCCAPSPAFPALFPISACFPLVSPLCETSKPAILGVHPSRACKTMCNARGVLSGPE